MKFDGQRQPNTLYVASVSRGKDSTAMLEAVRLLGWPLDGIVSVDIWATDEIPAELPEMVTFKKEWDEKCLCHFGLPVSRLHAKDKDGTKRTFEGGMTKRLSKNDGRAYGFPVLTRPWCNGYLKTDVLTAKAIAEALGAAPKSKVFHYIGIAADEAKRVERWGGRDSCALPLVAIGWDESTCFQIAEELDMLSPTYTRGTRDGCWFCQNQGVAQLRNLRALYPDLWRKLLEWDTLSKIPFKPDGHTVHDYDRRFQAEDEGYITAGDRSFKWDDLNALQMNIFQFLRE